MKQTKYLLYIITPLILLLFAACTKEGALVVVPVKAVRPLVMDGFIVGDTVEQYFDGVKVRDFFGRVNLKGDISQIAFEQDETTMELKRKSSGETVFKQTFRIAQDTCKIPKFYFDGTKMNDGFDYPTPQGNDWLISIYLGSPAGSPAAELVAEVQEWGFDADWNLVELGKRNVVLAKDIQPGKWTPYFKLDFGNLPLSDPMNFFQAVSYLRQSGTDKYYAGNNKENSLLRLQLFDPFYGPNDPMVQSLYIGWVEADKKVLLQPQQNLVDIFR